MLKKKLLKEHFYLGAPVRNFASQFLLGEASFQIASLYDVLGGKESFYNHNYPSVSDKSFDLGSSSCDKPDNEFSSASSSDILRGKFKILHQNFCFKDCKYMAMIYKKN